MIDENEELPQDIMSAQEHANDLQNYFPDLTVACVHGKLKAKEKNEIERILMALSAEAAGFGEEIIEEPTLF